MVTVVYVDANIVENTISIRKSKKIKLPDELLAATVLVGGYVLLTRNVEDFKGIANLEIENPWEW
ncbi:PIN domain-containing protein [Pedobacter sp.]